MYCGVTCDGRVYFASTGGDWVSRLDSVGEDNQLEGVPAASQNFAHSHTEEAPWQTNTHRLPLMASSTSASALASVDRVHRTLDNALTSSSVYNDADEGNKPSSTSASCKGTNTLTRAQLAKRIAHGETLVLRGRTIYMLDNWLKRHPGGELAILHFVGRDASDEIEVYHSEETLRRMRVFAVATLTEDSWHGKDGAGYKPLIPPVQLGYRSGRLDHPDAHEDLWRRKRLSISAGHDRPRRELSPMTDSDSGYESRGQDDDDDDVDNRDPSMIRPQTFPLPVRLLEPPPDDPELVLPAKEKQVSLAFKELHQQVKDAGLYTLRPSGYARECVRYFSLGLTAYLLWHHADGYRYRYLLSSFFLGLFWHQLTFSAHDAGHAGITHVHAVDRAIGLLIADFIGGLSLGWWCDNHDIHHLVTNHPEHDPDIQHMPFFAISPRFIPATSPANTPTPSLGLWSSYYRRVLTFDAPARLFLRAQHQLYYIVMSLGRFNLYANSYSFLALKARRDKWFLAESVGIVVFWSWFGALLASCPDWTTRIAYLLISHVATSPLHMQIVLSHFAQSSVDVGLSESFAARQVRTTMDVACPRYLDFLHGGLHMQVSHHLFPRLPRHNLRECRDRFVRPFCDEWGLRYQEYSFHEGNRRVLGVLRDVADQVSILHKVAQAQARGEIHSH